MAQPLVSIVVSNFNYARYLGEAIESALGQLYEPVEVIVVDDGSTDESSAVIARFRESIRPVFKENGGQASALNAGFTAATGDIIIFLDADDLLDPSAVACVVAAHQQNTAKVQFRLRAIDQDGHSLGFTNPPHDRPMHQGSAVRSLLEVGRYVTPVMSGNAFARAALAPVMPIPTESFRVSADGYLVVSVAFHGDIVSIDDTLGSYRIHGSNAWAPTAVTAARLRAFSSHDADRYAAIRTEAARTGYWDGRAWPPRDHHHFRSRLSSLRLDPDQHLFAGDRRLGLVWTGLRTTISDRSLNRRRKVMMAIWFLVVGVGPRRAAVRSIELLYAPQARPSVVRKVAGLLRNRGR